MATNENLIPIPGRLHSVASEGHVAGADEIYDDTKGKNQSAINADVDAAIGTDSTEGTIKGRIKTNENDIDSLETAIGNDSTSGTVKGRIKAIEDSVGTANGIASLDNNGKVPSSQLPSYVDDVIEGYYYNSKFYKEAAHTTEITGETEKIYIDLATNNSYRWSGSVYVPIGNPDVYSKAEVNTLVNTEKTRAQGVEATKANTSDVNAALALKADKATTLAGYGITDAYTKSETYTKTEVNGLVDTHAPDEEDLTSINVGGTDVLKFKDKAYNPLTYSGMGRKILRKNIVNGVNTLTQNMISKPNTIYIIQYDYVISPENDNNIDVPEGCVLEFDGGSISNGTLVGNDTAIETGLTKIFGKEVTLDGSWNVKEGYPQWFGCVPDDNSIDTTPAIKKLVAVSIPIFFCAGVWYLSECLLHGNKNVILKGFSHAFNVRTYFRPFTAGQRFILKLGGYADFSPVTNETYAENSCRNFEVSGISFYVPSNKKLINADQTGTYQNYAALCFDWCSEGHVDVSVYETFSPTLFIANSWEICFDNVEVYGSYTEMQEYAIYFGRAYTSVKTSNISQIKMLNIFGENIWGHLIGNKNANIVDLVINNIEAEIMPNLRPTTPISDAIGYIRNNVRTVDKYYMIELGGSHVYIMNCDIQLQDFAFTHDNTDYIMGSVLATDNLTIGVLANGRNARNTIVGTINSVSQLQIEEVNGYKYNDGSYPASLLTIAPQIDFTDHNYFNNNLDKLNCGIFVGRSNIIQNIDLIKEYGPGLLFDADTYSEVTSLRVWNNNLFVLESIINGVIYKFLSVYNGVKTLDRKMKFKDTSALRITYTGRNYYQNTDDVIVITYYKNGEVVETGSFGMPYSDDVISFDIELYQGNYDYCTFKINGVLSIKSVYVLEKVVEEQVVVFGSEISSDVLGIMSHYARDDAYKRTALQYFFDTIGNIKNKLNHLILPIFADNITEAIYDIITGQPLTNIDGGNYLEFNKPTRRVHVSTPNIGGQWRRWSYRLYNPTSTFEGAMVIMSATNNLGTGEGGHPTAPVMYGAVFYLNNSSVGQFVPRTTDNVKIIGGGIVGDSEDRYYLRVGDTLGSDRVTAFTTFQDWWDNYTQPFGRMPLDKTRGVRILVSSDQLLTKDEADILRDAVLALDNKFAILDEVNDNYTPAVEKLLIPNSGTWNDKPSSADIPVGFAYFCTDKQTTEGAADGMMIYYKGNSVWVDALGRVVS